LVVTLTWMPKSEGLRTFPLEVHSTPGAYGAESVFLPLVVVSTKRNAILNG